MDKKHEKLLRKFNQGYFSPKYSPRRRKALKELRREERKEMVRTLTTLRGLNSLTQGGRFFFLAIMLFVLVTLWATTGISYLYLFGIMMNVGIVLFMLCMGPKGKKLLLQDASIAFFGAGLIGFFLWSVGVF